MFIHDDRLPFLNQRFALPLVNRQTNASDALAKTTSSFISLSFCWEPYGLFPSY